MFDWLLINRQLLKLERKFRNTQESCRELTTLEVRGPAGEEDNMVAEGQHLGDGMSLKQTTSRGKPQDVVLVDSPQVGKALGTQFSLKKAEDDWRLEAGGRWPYAGFYEGRLVALNKSSYCWHRQHYEPRTIVQA